MANTKKYKLLHVTDAWIDFKQRRMSQEVKKYREENNITAAKLDSSYTKPLYEMVQSQYPQYMICNSLEEVRLIMQERTKGDIKKQTKTEFKKMIDCREYKPLIVPQIKRLGVLSNTNEVWDNKFIIYQV